MLQSITYLRYESKTNEYIHQLVDDDFICLVAVAVAAGVCSVTAAVAAEYKKRNLPVAKNIVLLYLDYQQKGYDINGWENYNYKWIDKYYPELEYSKLYHSQIVNQLHKIMMLS